MTRRIAIAEPDLSRLEEEYALAAIRSTWISSTGEFLARFEREFASSSSVAHALAVSNGTTAIHLALAALNVGPGDEVIVPSMTYIATANAVRYCGAEPVFVDVEPRTWCIDPSRVEEAITPRTKGMIAVHLLGHPADMDPLLDIASIHGLWVVEDAAEATFATYKGRTVGSLGRIGTFSFFGNKVLTCGEGGAVTFQDPALLTRLRMLRGQGMDPRQRYYFPIVGFNYRLTNVAAAILCGQMERRGDILRRRREIVALYERRLRGIPGIGVRDDAAWATTSPWMFAVTLDGEGGVDRDSVARRLAEAGIETRPLFVPIHALPPYRVAHGRRGGDLPLTTRLGRDGIMLPTHTLLTDDDIHEVCDRLVAAVEATRPSQGRLRVA